MVMTFLYSMIKFYHSHHFAEAMLSYVIGPKYARSPLSREILANMYRCKDETNASLERLLTATETREKGQ
jgi:hypothetical protein